MLLGKKYASAIVAAFTALTASAVAQASPVLIGSFEGNQSDGWGWFNIPNNFSIDPFATNPNVTYSYVTTGATDGTSALSVDGAGFQSFDLAYDLVGNGHLQDFMNNDNLSFDMTFPVSSASSGYAQVYSVVLNSNTGGFTQVGDAPYANQYPPYNGQTNHVTLNYDSYKQAMGSGAVNYLQLFLTTNNGGGAPSAMYLDNFRLTPNPILGDTDNNFNVGLDDLNNVLNNFGADGTPDPLGDTDNNNNVGLDDLNNVLNNFGASAADLEEANALLAAHGFASVVPEPTSTAVLGIGSLGILCRRRRA